MDLTSALSVGTVAKKLGFCHAEIVRKIHTKRVPATRRLLGHQLFICGYFIRRLVETRLPPFCALLNTGSCSDCAGGMLPAVKPKPRRHA